MLSGLKIQRALFIFWNLLFALSLRAEEDFTFFESKIRPVFVEHCYNCHSAEAEKVKGGLLLDTKDGLLKGGESGPAIIPGDPDKSLLIIAVRYVDKDLQMPPKDKKLSDTQIADLAAWVKMGAPDPRTGPSRPKKEVVVYDFAAARTNWAFHFPKVPPVPKIKNKKWAKSPIDHFILEKLEAQNLQPAPVADKRMLIRRATFDLIGLPPMPEEIDAFLKDKSPNAFAKVVDRLLASPHYGERWARHWLDVVRYTDSLDSRVVGTEQDSIDAWRYRDWTVNAFNKDLPCDQFIIQQIAGDLLPPPEPDGLDTNAIIATGMYAIGNWGNGDADKDKILTDIADDAVDVTGRAFLGLTLACARCHDHKFDPIPTADYYSMAGIFFSSHILAKLTPKGAGENLMRIPLISKAETERRKKREARMAELEKEIEKIQDEQISALFENVKSSTALYLLAAWEIQNGRSSRGDEAPASSVKNQKSKIKNDQSLLTAAVTNDLNEAVLRRWLDFLSTGHLGLFTKPVPNLLGMAHLSAWRNSDNVDNPVIVANASDQEAIIGTLKLPPRRLEIHPSPKNGVAIAWKSPVSSALEIRGRIVDVDPNCGDGVDWELTKISGGASESLAKGSIASGGTEEIAKSTLHLREVKAGEFLQIAVFPKGGYECDSTMVEWEIAEMSGQKRVWNLNSDVVPDLLASNPHADSFGNADVWYFRDLAKKNLDAPAESGITQWLRKVGRVSPLRAEVEKTNNGAHGVTRPTFEEIKAIAEKIQQEILAAQNSTNAGFYQSFIAPRGAFWAPLRNDEKAFPSEAKTTLQKYKAELATLRSQPVPPIAMTHGMLEGGVPESPHAGVHDVKIHVRGRYDRLGEVAPRKFPRVLAGDDQKPVTEGSGRLQLAKWIASPTNPLTARVMMNRIWQQHFGEGIVRTPNNYGKLGTPPTHPELLDFLAHRFVESGWSIKAMHRAIMLSAVYQQSSVPEPATLKADPENKLLGRMNRRRLDAESLRDAVLAVTQKLDPALGGPAIRDFNNNRRTLYLMTIRSDRANYKSLFDGADGNSIIEQRIVSTVAPQALFLLNHPSMLAQTKALVEKVGALKNADDKAKIEWLYRNLYGRNPTPKEIKIGREALKQTDDALGKNEKLYLEQYCQVLLCANEFVYVD